MSNPQTTSALSTDVKISQAIVVEEVKLGMIDLRGDVKNKKFAAAAKKIFGYSLPTKPRTSAENSDVTALWLSPDQWLLTCPQDRTENLLKQLVESLAGIHSLVVDVSDARCVLRLSGDGARETLMKGSSVDLSTQECTAGYTRRLLFAEQAALIHIKTQSPDIIDLFIFRSFANYIWKWLDMTSAKSAEVNLFRKQNKIQV